MARKIKALKFFLSYSHKDMRMKEKLLEHLRALEKIYNIEVWHDGCIDGGSDIEEDVFKALEISNVVLLLVSNNYIVSDFCFGKELEAALKRHKNKTCTVIPIILSPTSNLSKMPFGGIKSFPQDRKPITEYHPQAKGFAEVVESITSVLDKKYVEYSRENIAYVSTFTNEPISVPISFKVYKSGKLEDFEVNQSLMTSIKLFATCINDFHNKMNETMFSHVAEYEKNINTHRRITNKMRLKRLEGFLLDICMNTKTCLFPNVGVRIHFRRLKNGGYLGFTAIDSMNNSSSRINWEQQLSTLNKNNNMVLHSIELNHILIKSLNKKFHSKSSNDKIWVDYVTCGFPNIDQAKAVLLSMGISIHKDFIKSYQDRLMCLSFYRFDNVVENYIKTYINSCMKIDNGYDINIIANA